MDPKYVNYIANPKDNIHILTIILLLWPSPTPNILNTVPNPKTLYIFLTQLYHIVIIIITLTKANPKDINYIANPKDNIHIFDTALLLLLLPRPTPKVLTPNILYSFLTQLYCYYYFVQGQPQRHWLYCPPGYRFNLVSVLLLLL